MPGEEAAVEWIAAADAKAMLDAGEAIAIDVREAAEIEVTGTVPGALTIPRGMIADAADPDSPDYDRRLRTETPVILFCASGKRSEMAGQTLLDLGYQRVHNLGGVKDWTEAGYALEPAVND